MSEITIRSPQEADCYNLARLIASPFAGRSDQSLDEGEYFQKWLANFKLMLTQDLTRIYVAENAEGELVGVITAYLLPRLELAGFYSVIEDVFVKESERSKGIGALLFAAAIEDLKEAEVKYITLNVAPDNLRGQAFYKKLGFETNEVAMSLNLWKNK